MAKALPRAPVPGPAFIRLLARLSDAPMPASSPALADRLGQWIDWNRAVAVSRALDGKLPEPAEDAPAAPEPSALEAECGRVRAALEESIALDIAKETGKPVGKRQHDPDAPIEYAPFRQRYLALQRAMLTATGRLRGLLRDALVPLSPDMARLAEVDAVMELTLSPREQTLLATVPNLLETHFQRLRATAAPVPDPTLTDAPPAPSDAAWLALFRQDLHSVLRAELDVRFHPIEALLAALRSR
ncbi:hypothetical protein ACP93_17685 [Xanthomonas sp. NCPPB 1128]|uniref:DUF3348 domain-containing protein n=1 Tax=Xanthomonas sp. NCPPB 1128 TaxID=1775876 RepID=UPI00065AF38F|nr:DUF3348 domain-containing protein [Xanthomonas sp. NCPPB 1128]KMM74220.1 hypothetical protein ACP93_17685 [Xanthomonas sp. NCPPB 1128]